MNDITIRFIAVFDSLLNDNFIKSRLDFAKKIGISSSSLTEIFNKRTNVGIKVIQKTVNTFNHINAEWLLTGNGDVIKSKFGGVNGNNNNKINISNGYMKNVGNSTIKEDCNNVEIEVKSLKTEIEHLKEKSSYLKEKISDLEKQLKLKDRIIEMLDQQVHK